MKSTYKFHKKPDKYTKEELDLTIQANLLEFLQQLDIIDLDLWVEVAIPIEGRIDMFIIGRGLIKGKL